MLGAARSNTATPPRLRDNPCSYTGAGRRSISRLGEQGILSFGHHAGTLPRHGSGSLPVAGHATRSAASLNRRTRRKRSSLSCATSSRRPTRGEHVDEIPRLVNVSWRSLAAYQQDQDERVGQVDVPEFPPRLRARGAQCPGWSMQSAGRIAPGETMPKPRRARKTRDGGSSVRRAMCGAGIPSAARL